MKLGDVLISYRMEHNYSIREFAKICDLSPAQILFMERGTNSQGNPFVPKVKSLKKVAAGMGITFGELVAICDDNLVIGKAENTDRAGMNIKVFLHLFCRGKR